MQLEQTQIDMKDIEILMMQNELKKFIQSMQAQGLLTTVDINEVTSVLKID